MEDGNGDVEDEIVTEGVRKKAEAAKRRADAAAKKAAEKAAEEAKKVKRAAEAAKEKAAKEKRLREKEKDKEKERREREERESRKRKSLSRSRSRSRKRRTSSRPRRRSRSRSKRRSRLKSRRRSRSRVESRSVSMDNAALKTQVERLTEKVKCMENRRKWNHPANKKQYLHQIRVRQLCIEDVRKQLEDYFGSRKDVPERIEEAIKIGEKEVDERIKMLRMANKVSWLAVDKFVADPLCDNDEEDKK